MANLQHAVFLKIKTVAQLEAIKNTLSMAMDMRGDMFTDEAYLQVKDVRKLAEQSDEEIKAEISKRDKIIYANLDEMMALNELLYHLTMAMDEADRR